MSEVHIKLSVKPEWGNIAVFRDFIKNFFLGKIDDNKLNDITFIVSELFENAIKYSSDGNVTIELNQIGTVEHNGKMQIYIENRVDQHNFTKLMNEFIEISNEPIEEIYKMKYSSESFWEAKSGALGLVMLSDRCEGKIALSLKDDMAMIKCFVPLKDQVDE